MGTLCCSDELIKAKLLGDNANIGWTREHIMYNGLYVVPVDAWDVLNEATATNGVRALLTVKGNLGAAFDVSKTTGGSPDIAFEAEQRLGPGDGIYGQSLRTCKLRTWNWYLKQGLSILCILC